MQTETIVFTDAYTGQETYGRIGKGLSNRVNVHIISKEEAGPNPTRMVFKADPSIAKITNGTGIVK